MPSTRPAVADPARLQAIEHTLELFFPDAPDDAWLVVSWLAAPGDFRSRWFRMAEREAAVQFMALQAEDCDVYVAMGLRHPQCRPHGRGKSEDVSAIGGLWVELDHSGGVHAAQNLPTPYQLRQFLHALPFRFSLVIDSTGGYHGHLLFKELWTLDTPTEQQAAALLLRRLQRTVQLAAAAHGWHVDSTADLARVLRPAVTSNHKSGTPQPVTILEEHTIRYNPLDLADAPWMAIIEDTYTPTGAIGHGDFPPTPLDAIVTGCGWLRHCRDDAVMLPEPEWYAMLGILGRCEDGEQQAHAWSQPYPRYHKEETARKLQHALQDAGPATCSRIRFDLGGEPFCQHCIHWQKLKSPIVLGMPPDDGVRLVSHNGTTSGAVPGSRPIMRVRTDIEALVDATEDALRALPDGPHLFQRAGHLALIARGAPTPRWLRHRGPDTPVIVPAHPASVRELAARAATWAKFDKRSKRWEESLPPPWIIETLMARRAWRFPVLEGLVSTPTMRPDGSLVTMPGYDATTGLYLEGSLADYPGLRDHPTQDDARHALAALAAVLVNFPFASPWHQSSAIAAILSLLVRYAIEGNVPLFAVTSTTRGSGKGLLVDVISLIGTGRIAPRMAQTQQEDEERKRLMTLALAGTAVVHLDNLTTPLGSAPLDMVLTASSITDRLLGSNEQREASLQTVFFASGNNMQFRGDTARRVLPIALAPEVEFPEQRTGFVHDPLLLWVATQRPPLVIAALTIVHAYFCAHLPAQGILPWGSYEAWSRLVRAAVLWAGAADPCEGRLDLEAHHDPAYERAATLLGCWSTCYATRPDGLLLRQVIQDALHFSADKGQPVNDWDALRDALGAFDERYDGKSLRLSPIGYALRSLKGRIINKMRLVSHLDKHTKVQTWRIERLP